MHYFSGLYKGGLRILPIFPFHTYFHITDTATFTIPKQQTASVSSKHPASASNNATATTPPLPPRSTYTSISQTNQDVYLRRIHLSPPIQHPPLQEHVPNRILPSSSLPLRPRRPQQQRIRSVARNTMVSKSNSTPPQRRQGFAPWQYS